MVKYILTNFQFALSMSKDDYLTIKFFDRLVKNENSEVFSAYQSDVEDFNVFVYKKDDYYTYYIPNEIRRIIKKELNM